jgi:hypothetical protein
MRQSGEVRHADVTAGSDAGDKLQRAWLARAGIKVREHIGQQQYRTLGTRNIHSDEPGLIANLYFARRRDFPSDVAASPLDITDRQPAEGPRSEPDDAGADLGQLG